MGVWGIMGGLQVWVMTGSTVIEPDHAPYSHAEIPQAAAHRHHCRRTASSGNVKVE